MILFSFDKKKLYIEWFLFDIDRSITGRLFCKFWEMTEFTLQMEKAVYFENTVKFDCIIL